MRSIPATEPSESSPQRLFQVIPLPLPVGARTLLSWPPQPLSRRRASAPSVEIHPLSACAAPNSRPQTARTAAAPTSTGGAPTAQVTGSNRHPGAAARGGAEYLAGGGPLGWEHCPGNPCLERVSGACQRLRINQHTHSASTCRPASGVIPKQRSNAPSGRPSRRPLKRRGLLRTNGSGLVATEIWNRSTSRRSVLSTRSWPRAGMTPPDRSAVGQLREQIGGTNGLVSGRPFSDGTRLRHRCAKHPRRTRVRSTADDDSLTGEAVRS